MYATFFYNTYKILEQFRLYTFTKKLHFWDKMYKFFISVLFWNTEHLKHIEMVVRVQDKEWDDDLLDNKTTPYLDLAKEIRLKVYN